MQERIILIAEDDEEAIQSWERDIKELNTQPDQKVVFLPKYAKSKDSAARQLRETRLHCAIIDLRLPEYDGSSQLTAKNPLGNKILEQILLEVGIPAVVYSGYPQEASDLVTSSRIHVIGKKGNGAMEALKWLLDHENLMAAMSATQKEIEKKSAILFHQSIWPRWESTWKKFRNSSELQGVITRQTVSHIAEELTLNSQFCHPEEFYIVPSLSTDKLCTGDLVIKNEVVYVVVTPRCNLARDYPKHLMLANCKPMDKILNDMRIQFEGEIKKQEKAKKELSSYATQGHATGTHFIPPCGTKGPWLVDFKAIMTVESSSIAELLATRFATIAPQFVPNLIQRYASYLGRIGQPDLDCEILRESIMLLK